MNNDFDNQIINALNHKADNISPDDKMLFNIKNAIVKENINMKKKYFSFKKITAVCLAVIAIGAVTAIGAGKVKYTSSHSYRDDEIRHFPTQEELSQYINYSPKYVQNLGGYEFDYAIPKQAEQKDSDGNTLSKFTDVSFNYKTDKGSLSLNTSPDNNAEDYTYYNYEKTSYNGLTLYYNAIKYKFVPPDYVLTDDDKKLQSEKKLEISYGTDKIEYSNATSIMWCDNGVEYCILDMDANISKNDMINMAKEVIDAK